MCHTLYVSLFSSYVPHAISISLPPVCATRYMYLSSPRMYHTLYVSPFSPYVPHGICISLPEGSTGG
jgi:phage tail protein X